jgi:hypothetical protein
LWPYDGDEMPKLTVAYENLVYNVADAGLFEKVS